MERIVNLYAPEDIKNKAAKGWSRLVNLGSEAGTLSAGDSLRSTEHRRLILSPGRQPAIHLK